MRISAISGRAAGSFQSDHSSSTIYFDDGSTLNTGTINIAE